MELIELRKGDITARINPQNQQLVSLASKEFPKHEFMHGGGNPCSQRPEDKLGWKNSELVMFPVVGSPKGGKLRINGCDYPMTKHGIVRHMQWTPGQVTRDVACFSLDYEANTPVRNTKTGPDAGPAELVLPFNFRLEKQYAMTDYGMTVQFTIHTNSREHGALPGAFGWHPAFKTFKANGYEKNGKIKVFGSDSYTFGVDYLQFKDIDVCDKALKLKSCFADYIGQGPMLRLHSTLEKMMLWSPVHSELFCMEPVNHLPGEDGMPTMFGNQMSCYFVELQLYE